MWENNIFKVIFECKTPLNNSYKVIISIVDFNFIQIESIKLCLKLCNPTDFKHFKEF